MFINAGGIGGTGPRPTCSGNRQCTLHRWRLQVSFPDLHTALAQRCSIFWQELDLHEHRIQLSQQISVKAFLHPLQLVYINMNQCQLLGIALLHLSKSWCSKPHLCRPWALKYAKDEKAFFEDYAKAHVKLSEVGELLYTATDCLQSYCHWCKVLPSKGASAPKSFWRFHICIKTSFARR